MPPLRWIVRTAIVATIIPTAAAEWRSALYPEDWTPGHKDAEGRFLHDFSYAGYHRGEKPLPVRDGAAIDVTVPPYNADPTGKNDATAAIQAALDAAGAAGGGIVFLPPGTYRVAPAEGSHAALKLQHDNVVLRGAGADQTFLFNDSTAMRGKGIIEVKPNPAPWWYGSGKWITESPATADIPGGAFDIPVKDASLFATGDVVVVRNDVTQHFIDELGMKDDWTPGKPEKAALLFCRRVTAVDTDNHTVTVDVPTRYPLKKADNARVVKIPGRMVSEVGLEDFSIGMREHPGAEWGDHDYTKEGSAAYDVHQSFAIVLEAAENCWVRGVHSYLPPDNASGFHLLSNGIKLGRSRFITVAECDFRTAQYQGGGGNGYLYTLFGNDCLVRDCHGEAGRHNYDFQNGSANGNVILDCTTKDGLLASDFHMYFSVANLIDNMTCDGDFVEAVFRPYGWPIHGVTTSQSVFWNTHGLRYPERKPIIVESKQFGDGYVIGTRGPAHAVDSDDFVEGVGEGDSLAPRSLYQDQLERRLERDGKPVPNYSKADR